VNSSSRQSSIPARLLALVSCALAAGLALAACGGGQEVAGTITVSQTGEPERLDPAFAYTGEGLATVGASEPLSLVYTPLLTYRHEEGERGAELIPGLARDLPEVSDDGLTYRLTLRDELEYSNGDRVRARDFEHTIKRLLVAGTPAARFFDHVVGAETFALAGVADGEISGIESDDETGEITIRLTQPDASFPYALGMWFAGLVPANTQFRDRSADPPPGVGPYEITEAEPGTRFVLSKSASFTELAIPDIPTGNVDEVVVEIIASVERQAEEVLSNELDYMRDSPPPEVKSTLLSEGQERYREHIAAGTYLFFLDPESPPFDDPRARQAVNHALDRAELARAFEGELEPGCSFLPPGIAGYDEELDTTACPYGDPSEPPDEHRARRLIRRAGAVGTAVTVAGSDEPGIEAATESYAETLRVIGLDATTRILTHEAYLQRLARGRPPGDTGFASSFPDFPHPLRPYSLLTGISAGGDAVASLPIVADPIVADEVERLNLEPDLESVAEDWAALDGYVVSPPQSYIAPIGHPKLTTFVSERLDIDQASFHPVFLNDYSSFVLAPDES